MPFTLNSILSVCFCAIVELPILAIRIFSICEARGLGITSIFATNCPSIRQMIRCRIAALLSDRTTRWHLQFYLLLFLRGALTEPILSTDIAALFWLATFWRFFHLASAVLIWPRLFGR